MKKIVQTNNYFNYGSEEKYLGKYFTSYSERFNSKKIEDNFIIEIKNVPGVELLTNINNIIAVLLNQDDKYWVNTYNVEIIKDQVLQTSICKITLDSFDLATYICELLDLYENGFIHFESNPKINDDFASPYTLDDCRSDSRMRDIKTFNATVSRERLNKIFSILLNSKETSTENLIIYNLWINPIYLCMPNEDTKFAFDVNFSIEEDSKKTSILSILNQK